MVRTLLTMAMVACAAGTDTTTYCCPDAKKCLTPSSTQCDPADASACSDAAFPVCCPVTKLCVKPGADCVAPPVCSSTEYCCPDAKHCLEASKTSCATDAKACDGSDTPVCCPLTKLCVKVGAACESPCEAQSSTMSLIPGKIDLNPVCYECPNATYAEMVAEKDPLVKAHGKVSGSCADQGYAKSLGNDPVFPDAKLFRKGQVELPRNDTRMSLIPGKIDLNPVCYECPNATYVEMVAEKDPLVKAHTKVSGSCADQGYAKSLGNDPVFPDAKLFRKGQDAELVV